jgi:hypothetical protein
MSNQPIELERRQPAEFRWHAPKLSFEAYHIAALSQ